MMKKALAALALAALTGAAFAQIGQEAVSEGNTSFGVLSAKKQAVISASMSGVIERLDAQKLASTIEKGSSIARIDCSAIKAELNAANAKASKARIDTKRAKVQYAYVTPQGEAMPAISKNELDSVRKDEQSLWAEANAKKAKLKGCSVSAPFSGAVANIYAKTGQYVNAGDPLVELVDNSELVAEFTPPAWEWETFAVGNKAKIKILPLSKNAQEAEIEIIERGAAMDGQGRFVVRGKLKASDASGKVAGMPFSVSHQ